MLAQYLYPVTLITCLSTVRLAELPLVREDAVLEG